MARRESFIWGSRDHDEAVCMKLCASTLSYVLCLSYHYRYNRAIRPGAYRTYMLLLIQDLVNLSVLVQWEEGMVWPQLLLRAAALRIPLSLLAVSRGS